ncbi:MAG: MgtC/SapB family protein [Bacteroidia bacterium]|jgi:uncharacterized membrane protein (DUF4010 family)
MHDLINTLFSPFLFSFITAIGIGLVVGFQREFDIVSGNQHYAGIRSFALTAALGCLSSFIAQEFTPFFLVGAIVSFLFYMSIFHYTKAQKENFGIITELSLTLVFMLGVLSGYHLMKEALAASVIIVLLLSFKNKFKETIKKITQEELYGFLRFVILAFLIMPYLPDIDYGPDGILNPQKIGYVILIISCLSFFGYFIIKFFGAKKGILFTAFFGGTFSSTAVTWTFSSRSKENPALSVQYAGGIAIAASVMFLRVAIIAAIFNFRVFQLLALPCAIMIITSVSYAIYILRKQDASSFKTSEEIKLGNPLDILNAGLFGGLYILLTLFVYYANLKFGEKGLYVTGLISGLTDVDAINISVSKLSLDQINPNLAAIVILLAIISNTVFKITETMFKGSKVLYKHVLFALIPSVIIAVISIIFLKFQI